MLEERVLKVQETTLHDAPLMHQLYLDTPQYFEMLGTPIPTLLEVQREVEFALRDPRRRLELLFDGERAIGCLDYKLHYPARGDITINLLMIAGPAQNRRYGSLALGHLEERLPAGTRRLLASVLGNNARAARFWERHGFSFAIDARPVMEWYAKEIGGSTSPMSLRQTKLPA
ncbi:GNAT family N-acetyltransferase [Deinococcus peraridilitoris]|uniref:Acetyltransferase (GNAT) family protein n=1 Tax=Deinococcus peraridilitoris (strain DSM 19664 / LMG 22246 / CIP 109416 / KR-200) TaxID=937777 RepID=L0A232_DEIPD|nr:GNAT family N-acetyltransferase [Deinococcus peraridilitoris]AFZ67906.1 acetyltransferase (GNAT) family protein [Deinococcus peraridilitoris DSM 19664]